MTADRDDAIEVFLAASGWGAAVRAPLPGDASTRRYERLTMNGRRAMLMDQPQTAETPAAAANATPEERHALGYNAIARLAGADCGRFIAASNYLRKRGLSAPQIYAATPLKACGHRRSRRRALCGRCEGRGTKPICIRAAADVLAVLHADSAPSVLPPDKPFHAFDETAQLAEIDLLTEWFIPVALGRKPGADEVAEHRALWRAGPCRCEEARCRVRAPRLSCAEPAVAARSRGRGARRTDRFPGRRSGVKGL